MRSNIEAVSIPFPSPVRFRSSDDKVRGERSAQSRKFYSRYCNEAIKKIESFLKIYWEKNIFFPFHELQRHILESKFYLYTRSWRRKKIGTPTNISEK